MTCRWKPWLEDVDEAPRQGRKTFEDSSADESETDRALRREVRRLTETLSRLEAQDKRLREGKKKCKKCLLSRCNRGEGCPANTRRCNR